MCPVRLVPHIATADTGHCTINITKMKYLKIFMLTVAAVVLASCSDDESFNTLQTTPHN